MTWVELKIQTKANKVELLSNFLTEIGALAVTTEDAGDQPLYELPPGATSLWDEVTITGLFDEHANVQVILASISSEFPEMVPVVNELDDRDWERTWMDDFHPMQFGSRLFVVPSYHEEVFSSHQMVLDPGLAFGTGKHPTTALCLKWLDQHIQDQEVVIDYGCGSGILAIAAVKLGAKQVFAIDHDPQALIATDENAKRNGLTTHQIVALSPDQFVPQRAELLIANILANPLIELAESFSHMLNTKGKIILSGILSHQTTMVIEAYQPFFEIVNVEQQEEWVRIDGYKIGCC